MDMQFGVEMEFLYHKRLDRLQIVELLSEYSGLDVVTYQSANNDQWKIVSDASCGLELVSPILYGEDGLDKVKRICNAAKKVGLRVSTRCGLHVHHDASFITQPQQFIDLVANYKHFEDLLDAIQPNHRQGANNRYCLPTKKFANVDAESVRYLLAYTQRNRYMKLNVMSYLRHGTVEFRHHSATFDWKRVTNWIKLTHHMMECFTMQDLTNINDVAEKARILFTTFEQQQGQQEMPTKLRDIKAALGMTAREAKEYAHVNGLGANLDMRKKASWQVILSHKQGLNTRQVANNLLPFYRSKISHLVAA
jgi:hypothetical protein